MDKEQSDDEKKQLIDDAEKMRQDLERQVEQDAWDECDLILGMMGAIEITGIICKVRVPTQGSDNVDEFSLVPAVAIPATEFDKYKGLLAQLA